MKRRRIALLVATHLLVAAVAAVGVGSWRASAPVQPVRQDPLSRLALAMDGSSAVTGYGAAAFERDVQGVSQARPGPLGDVLRLIRALHAAEPERAESFAQAAKLCQSLGWPACDQQSLLEIRKATVR